MGRVNPWCDVTRCLNRATHLATGWFRDDDDPRSVLAVCPHHADVADCGEHAAALIQELAE